YERRVAAAMRSDKWAGARLGDRELHIWGTPFYESPLRKAKRTLHEAVLRKRVMSAYDLSAPRLAEAVAEIVRYRPQLIVGYTNSLHLIARYALETGAKLP